MARPVFSSNAIWLLTVLGVANAVALVFETRAVGAEEILPATVFARITGNRYGATERGHLCASRSAWTLIRSVGHTIVVIVGIASITFTVAVGVQLIWICNQRAIVGAISIAIAIAVRLEVVNGAIKIKQIGVNVV